ncbi:hypothetical protein [Nonlabens ulvanivorans]|uniref:hypothetical protein n=1 Tax=Nonlabens ulvanivorans TaxID=906888 RepID=UPI002942F101|nr:hypothetical protein [Nonlabens ulvanivorans]WOI23482.1 hypothetical protein R1T42_03305 [Nonlabens ulvanivorans]
MSELTKDMNELLRDIDKNRWISLSKDSPKKIFKAKDKLRAFGLIERQGKYSWRLTQSGYEAVELGGFDEWLAQNKTDKNQKLEQTYNAKNINVNNNNQSNENNPEGNTNKPESIVKRIVIGVLIIIIAGIAMIYIKNYLNPKTENSLQEKNIAQPISIVFQDGEMAEVRYSINLSLIDSLVLTTAKRFGNEEKAINYIHLKTKNQIISTLESTTIETARLKRDSLSKIIINKTINEQVYGGYKISTLNLNEIKTVANNGYK